MRCRHERQVGSKPSRKSRAALGSTSEKLERARRSVSFPWRRLRDIRTASQNLDVACQETTWVRVVSVTPNSIVTSRPGLVGWRGVVYRLTCVPAPHLRLTPDAGRGQGVRAPGAGSADRELSDPSARPLRLLPRSDVAERRPPHRTGPLCCGSVASRFQSTE